MLLLLGSNGQVGWELRRTLTPLGPVTATTRATLDLTNEAAIREAVRSLRPRVIVNAAAYTAVDAAESDQDACRWLNANVPGILAEEAERAGAWLVHYGTDYVFDGSATRPYREDDPVAPLGVYGQTKADGEAAIRSRCGRHLILRVAWVYGTRGKNFLRTVQRLALGDAPLRIVHDQVGHPTWSRTIAETTAGLLARHPTEVQAGTYHLAPPHTEGAPASWYDFATAIVDRLPPEQRRTPGVVPITTADYPTPARRPPWSVLDSGKLAATFGLTLPPWEAQLVLAMDGQE